jgi:hypothetical protein
MRKSLALILAVGSMLVRSGLASGEEKAVTSAYANVEVVSIDPVTRLAVIKNSKGAQETFEFDDNLAGVAGVKTGDSVTMTVRGEPGRQRVSAITLVAASPAPAKVSAAEASASGVPPADVTPVPVREHFAKQVASLSDQARGIDDVWGSFVTSCNAKRASKAEGGRDWFGLWDGRVKADLSSGSCRDLFNQLVTSGEGIKKAMASAEDVARKTMEPGEIRDICRRNSMDWDGWDLPAPQKLEP